MYRKSISKFHTHNAHSHARDTLLRTSVRMAPQDRPSPCLTLERPCRRSRCCNAQVGSGRFEQSPCTEPNEHAAPEQMEPPSFYSDLSDVDFGALGLAPRARGDQEPVQKGAVGKVRALALRVQAQRVLEQGCGDRKRGFGEL